MHCVWQNGRFQKVLNYNIKGKLLVWLINTYRDYVKSCSGTWDKIQSMQGISRDKTRRGHVKLVLPSVYRWTSKFTLPSNFGFKVGPLQRENPTLADDLTLVSNNLFDLTKILTIVKQYSIKWKIKYNQDKCVLLRFPLSNRIVSTVVSVGPFTFKQSNGIRDQYVK